MIDASLFHSRTLSTALFEQLGVIAGNNASPICDNRKGKHGPDEKIRMTYLKSRSKFVCPKKECQVSITARTGSFLKNMHLTENELFAILYCFVSGYNQTETQKATGVAYKTVLQWFTYMRKVCQVVVYTDYEGNKLGGIGSTIEIDEHKQCHRHGNIGRILAVEGVWIFGGIERDTGRVFIVRTATRDAASLIPLLKGFVHPGTKIISDGWGAYYHLDQHGFEHSKDDVVTHAGNFVHPDHPETHTQKIER